MPLECVTKTILKSTANMVTGYRIVCNYFLKEYLKDRCIRKQRVRGNISSLTRFCISIIIYGVTLTAVEACWNHWSNYIGCVGNEYKHRLEPNLDI
jgi:hypothetical protein